MRSEWSGPNEQADEAKTKRRGSEMKIGTNVKAGGFPWVDGSGP